MKFLKNLAAAALITTAFTAANAALDFSGVDGSDFDAVKAASKIAYTDSGSDITLRVDNDMVDGIAALKAFKATDADAANLIAFQTQVLESLVRIAGDAGKLKAFLGTKGGHIDVVVPAGFDASNADAKTYKAYYKAPLAALAKEINPKSPQQTLVEKLMATYAKKEFVDDKKKTHKLEDIDALYRTGKVADADTLVDKLTINRMGKDLTLKQLDEQVEALRVADHAAVLESHHQALISAHEAGKKAAKLTDDQQAMVDIFTNPKSVATIKRKLPALKGDDLATKVGVEKFMKVVEARLALVATLEAKVKLLEEEAKSAPKAKGSPFLGGGAGGGADDVSDDESEGAGPAHKALFD